MTVGHVNVKETIERIQKEISKDKSISPILISSIELLIIVIQMLLDRQSMNSSNSSLPPTTDKNRRSREKYKKKRKKKGEKSVGGQDGHTGTTLTQYEDVDEIIPLSIDRRTLPASGKFKLAEPETRQVIDLNLEFIIREYQAEVLISDDGTRFVAEFPEHITKAIQYGPSVKSFAVYMSQYQLIPYARVQEVFIDQFDLKISQGSLCNFNKEAFEKLKDFEESIIKILKDEEVLNVDETGVKIDTKLSWIHVVCTPKLTFLYPHERRGKEAMVEMGVIPSYSGYLIHDHWKPYLGYDCKHGLCNAHHIRELQWVIDFKQQKWAKSLNNFLNKLNDEVDQHGGILPIILQTKRIKRYREIIKTGKGECAQIMPTIGSRRKKVKQTKERNLLDRLCKYEDQVVLFMKVKNVPFTNNQAERDIRMVKVQHKVSGQFKSMAGAKHFCRIRSYLMTSKKKGFSPFDKLCSIFDPEA
jgi:transposase